MNEDFHKEVAIKIGQRLRLARKRRGHSLEDLATRSAMTARKLRRYESGDDRILICELEKLAVALSLPVTHFVDGCVLCGHD